MCGLFGLARNPAAQHPTRATEIFVRLGHLSMERGVHSAGYATVSAGGDVRVVKRLGRFDDMWAADATHHEAMIDSASVAVGHTRDASQGRTDLLVNAQPLEVGTLVGTHNGDITPESIPGFGELPARSGETDSEALFAALSVGGDRPDDDATLDVLSRTEGRAALAWVDRERPRLLHLVRAACSPLSYAYDDEGNLYWASSPRWFRDIATELRIAFDVTTVREGSWLMFKTCCAPTIDRSQTFIPTCRPGDADLWMCWKGLTDEDVRREKASFRHAVAPVTPTSAA